MNLTEAQKDSIDTLKERWIRVDRPHPVFGEEAVLVLVHGPPDGFSGPTFATAVIIEPDGKTRVIR